MFSVARHLPYRKMLLFPTALGWRMALRKRQPHGHALSLVPQHPHEARCGSACQPHRACCSASLLASVPWVLCETLPQNKVRSDRGHCPPCHPVSSQVQVHLEESGGQPQLRVEGSGVSCTVAVTLKMPCVQPSLRVLVTGQDCAS